MVFRKNTFYFIMNVLASVYNKSRLVEFLQNIGLEKNRLYASGGTFKFLTSKGLQCINTSDLTGFEDLFQGRVKTLHPAIFSGILARNTEEDRKTIEGLKYPLFDMVICNLYPFQEFASSGNTENMVENIDIGGVSLIRAAAKSHERIAVVVDPGDYEAVEREISSTGNVGEALRRRLAVKAFAHTASYDSLISRSFSRLYSLENSMLSLELNGGKKLRYGENPDQDGTLFEFPEGGKWKILQGKEMSYNNYVDATAALETCLEFQKPTSVVVKHNSPCGVASNDTIQESLERAIGADPESAYGSVICVNREFDSACFKVLGKVFVEIVMAPSFSADAKELLAKRKNLRAISYENRGMDFTMKSVYNGILIQTPMKADPEETKVVVGHLKEGEMDDLLFAWRVVARCRSNAMVLAKNESTVGIGAGQTSRIEALRIAVSRAKELADGSVLASDAYIPFPDNVELASEFGVSSIIQPGGSIRDQEVMEACRKRNVSMVFTGKRVFLH